MSIASKRVLLTGGSGFVGACLARRLLADGHEVHLLLRPEYQPWRVEDIRARVWFHLVDMSDVQVLRQVVQDVNPQWIFHLAAYGAYSSQQDIQRIIHTNIIRLSI